MENGRSILPPRKTNLPSRMPKHHSTPLQTLLQMGFPKHRAEKALAATGDRGAQLAADWLLAHVNDPTIDTDCPREYVLYACPADEFAHQVQKFFQYSLNECGRNQGHDFTPHIELVSFFKAPDECSLQLTQTMQQVVEDTVIAAGGVNAVDDLTVSPYVSSTYMALCLPEKAQTILRDIATSYVKEVSRNIISDTYEQLDPIAACFPWCASTATARLSLHPKTAPLESDVKALHLRLAANFAPETYQLLKASVDMTFETKQPSSWQICLYSRDSRAAGKKVYKVTRSHHARDGDELELRVGDYLYVTSDESAANDGWMEAISWLTGCSGLFPVSYATKTTETDAWTLHGSIPLCRDQDNPLSNIMSDAPGYSLIKCPPCADQGSGAESIPSREMFVMRHGERVDFTLGNWIDESFTSEGIYKRFDSNQPITVPQRADYPKSFARDTPLTNVGCTQARCTGEAMKEANVSIQHVFVSSALRCVQTAHNVLTGLGLEKSLPLNVEPGLFEWLQWYPGALPKFMTLEELCAAGYNVAKDYESSYTPETLANLTRETVEQYYNRHYQVAQRILQLTKEKGGGNVLVVGHASSLDTVTRQLCGNEPRTPAGMDEKMLPVHYCNMARVAEFNEGWKLVDPKIPGFSNTVNKRYDWHILQNFN